MNEFDNMKNTHCGVEAMLDFPRGSRAVATAEDLRLAELMAEIKSAELSPEEVALLRPYLSLSRWRADERPMDVRFAGLRAEANLSERRHGARAVALRAVATPALRAVRRSEVKPVTAADVQWPELPEEFVRCRGVKSTACLYFPEISPKSASRALRREIATFPELRQALESVNWHPARRTFTILQQRIIVHYLGLPPF